MSDSIPTRKGKYHCPKCDPKAAKSLSVHYDANDLFYKCHRCDYKGRVFNDKQPAAAPRYFYYKDENGKTLFRKVRIGDGPGKKIWLERPDAGGDWVTGTEGVKRVLYNTDKLAKAPPGSEIQFHEGEPKCDKAEELGYIAFANFEGAAKPDQKPKWRDEYTKQLAGFDVILFPDNDDAGRAHVEHIARVIHSTAKRVRICTLPGLPVKGDIIDDRHTKTEIDALIEAAPDWKRTPTKSNVINAVDLLALNLPELKTIVAGLLVVGLFFLAGKPKLGKSWLMLQIALAVAMGGRALGSIPVEPGEVLYLALEDGNRRLKSRLLMLLRDCTAQPSSLHFATSWKTLDNGGLEDLEDWLTDHPQTRLVVVDIAKRIRPRERPNVGAYGQDYEAYIPLQALALKFDVCIVLVHHTRKGASDDPLELLSGTNGLNGAADGTLILTRERGQADATLYVTGRDIQEAELALSWDPAVTLWSVLGNACESRVTPERAQVLKVLKDAGTELTPKYISDVIGKKPGTVRKLLWELSKDRFVTSPRFGKYLYNSNSSSSSSDGNSSNDSNDEMESVTSVTGVSRPLEQRPNSGSGRSFL